jgi:hypothetical protein
MVGQALHKGRYLYYRCRRTYAGSYEDECNSKYVRVDCLERAVLEEIASVLSDPARILAEASRLSEPENEGGAPRQSPEAELKDVEEKQARLVKLYVAGSMPEHILAQQAASLEARRSELEGALKREIPSRLSGPRRYGGCSARGIVGGPRLDPRLG